MEVIPVNFGLKYRPPKLGVQYVMRDSPTTHFVHEIPLAFVTKTANVDVVVKEIIEQNKMYLNPKVVSVNQVKRLIERLVKTLNNAAFLDDKENSQIDNNTSKNSSMQMLKGVSYPTQ